MARTSKPVKKARKAPRKPGPKKSGPRKPRAPARRRAAGTADPLLAATVKGATRREVGGVLIDTGPAGAARVKRVIYPPGFSWSVDLRALVGTERCEHAHVGLLARGAIHIEYPDGCVVEYAAPEIVAIEPGHVGWVVGEEPAVLVEVDFERDTIGRLGMPAAHRHT